MSEDICLTCDNSMTIHGKTPNYVVWKCENCNTYKKNPIESN